MKSSPGASRVYEARTVKESPSEKGLQLFPFHQTRTQAAVKNCDFPFLRSRQDWSHVIADWEAHVTVLWLLEKVGLHKNTAHRNSFPFQNVSAGGLLHTQQRRSGQGIPEINTSFLAVKMRFRPCFCFDHNEFLFLFFFAFLVSGQTVLGLDFCSSTLDAPLLIQYSSTREPGTGIYQRWSTAYNVNPTGFFDSMPARNNNNKILKK